MDHETAYWGVPGVRIADRRIWVGETSRALLSGEVHFWRLDASVWRAVLERVLDLGRWSALPG